jgi:class 3 adenylate cyclase
MEHDIRYCTTRDGVRIAYSIAGEGPWLVCCPEFVGSFSLDHLIDDQMAFWKGLWRGRRVVRYDMRGTGLSQRDVGPVSHEAVTLDLDAVVRASGARDFTLWASTLSGPRAIDWAVHHPGEVRRLVLHRTFARATDLMSREQVVSFAELARLHPETAAQVFADLPGRRAMPDAGVRAAQVYNQSASGEFVAALLLQGYDTTDVTELLPRLLTPTLVLHWNEDPMFSARLAQELAAKIPQARLALLSDGIMTHLAKGRIAEIHKLLNDFIDDGAAVERTVARAVQTILFTDLVGHTEMMRRLGDDRGREILREHERLTRDCIKQHGGTEIKTDGDSFMVSFGSVTAAMACAIALQRAFARRNESTDEPLHVRIGLNAGEPVEDEGDLFGSTVILAARIKDQAGAGEILIPEPLRHLLSGKSYVYADRGETMLKGFDDTVRLYEVRWRDA